MIGTNGRYGVINENSLICQWQVMVGKKISNIMNEVILSVESQNKYLHSHSFILA
jgi:uncharacterized surface anchored protein